MGGLVFGDLITSSGKPPYVPRMQPDLYNKILLECQAKLETLFERVVVPRDAPAKKDFGDIDFLAGGIKPVASSQGSIWLDIKHILGAELHIARGGSHSFGIPHPIVPEAFVEVDVELSPGDGTPDASSLFEWTRFMKGDSDLVQIIGVSHRPLGLTCNDRGLHVRVAQIEPYNKKKALLFLTNDPEKAMNFYGFDAAKYREGFADEEDLFDWATQARFFSPTIFAARVEKSNDRSRQSKRPLYRRFIEEYMPKHMDQGASNIWSREEVLQEALSMFDKHAEYNAMVEEHLSKGAEEQLWTEIREALPVEGSSLQFALKGLRRWVHFQDGQPQVSSEAVLEDQPLWTECAQSGSREDLLHWVQDHWEEVKVLEKARAATAKTAAQVA